MTLDEKLDSLIAPVCKAQGLEIVRIQLQGGSGLKTLQIMVERLDLKALTVDNCASLSRALSPLLDEHDLIEDNYLLEVSSPGIDRPLVRLKDFQRFKGFEAKIECHDLIDRRKRFLGRLEGLKEDNVLLMFEGQIIEIPFSKIAKSKLILTEELISAFSSKDEA